MKKSLFALVALCVLASPLAFASHLFKRDGDVQAVQGPRNPPALPLVCDPNVTYAPGTKCKERAVVEGTGVPERGLPAPKGMIVEGNGVPEASPPAKRCTQEAKVCPDGSRVGRTGPNCEFAACSTEGKKVYPRDHPPSFDCATVPSKNCAGKSVEPICTVIHGTTVNGKFTVAITTPLTEAAANALHDKLNAKKLKNGEFVGMSCALK